MGRSSISPVDVAATDAGRARGNVTQTRADRLEVFGTAAHDLRNPLTVILSLTELMLNERSLDTEEVRRFLEAIRSNADEMHRLLDDVQEIARLEGHHGDVARASTPVASLLEEAIADAGLEGTVALSIGPGITEWPLERERMRRAICLLLADAATRSASGTSVDVALVGDALAIEVCDDAPLLGSDALEELAESLRRGRRRKGDIGVGTGLGPALAARIVEAHGGSVSIAATPPRGTCIAIVLPKG